MRQLAAIMNEESPVVVFSWAKTCRGKRERLSAAILAASAVECGKFSSGDLVTVGYNANSDQLTLAAPARSRIIEKVEDSSRAAAGRTIADLGWRLEWVDIPNNVSARYRKVPWEWAQNASLQKKAI